MKIGLFFGSFNPIHIGHLILANYLVEETDLDEVWLVVTPHNPFKKKSSLLADHHRLRMVEMALEPYDKLKASNIEFGLKKPSYTIDTLTVLKEKYPKHDFSIIMGADNLNHFHKWKNYEQILEFYSVYVYPRTTGKVTELDAHPKITRVNAPIIELSSTFIRQSIAEKKCVKPMLDTAVWQYIDEMNFYKPKPTF
ncbi:MAG: nicotinate (nicotinamide) nucleotide adenylyltransferase [Flavobacteriales bacterium]|jgi:nicotinate-nucleotide adenylyltransferase|nr:nicotinate (nicotinamide) nucleotide adenylyltransferase [Flavobacteriales bacterium]